jgi:Pyruvate/2-oxoacid:ferredoxin oxidoreductase delta subunit
VYGGRRTRNYSLLDFLHGYIYARWLYLYIGIATGEHPLAKALIPFFSRFFSADTSAGRMGEGTTRLRGERLSPDRPGKPTFADTYHGKVLPLESARNLVTIGEEIRIACPEKVIPYARARDIVLKNPDHIVVLDCPCRASRQDPCHPIDVCLVVGEPFASFVAEHNPGRARHITQAEAVDILEAEDDRGHVHHAFFKDAMLNRFYAICNCCSCCCGAMQAQRHGIPMLASSGYVCRPNSDMCRGCGECVGFCQFGSLSLEDGYSLVDETRCMGCGVCTSKCANKALSLVREPARGEPLEILKLMNEA